MGTSDTTPIASLREALQTIQLGTTIPALNRTLVTQANLDFPLDIGDTGIADATFNLDNPFTASINLIDVIADASYKGVPLGQINVKGLNPPISAPGKTLITSRVVP